VIGFGEASGFNDENKTKGPNSSNMIESKRG